MDISSRLRALRAESRLTQAELATALGSKPTTVASWEQGKSNPDINMVVKIANYFDVSTDYLLNLTDTKHPARKYYYSGADLRKQGLLIEDTFEDEDFIKFKKLMATEKITPEILEKLLPVIRQIKNTFESDN